VYLALAKTVTRVLIVAKVRWNTVSSSIRILCVLVSLSSTLEHAGKPTRIWGTTTGENAEFSSIYIQRKHVQRKTL
jgi:hypothetical protein